MKQGGLVCVCLVLFFVCCLPVVAQPNYRSVETFEVDSFDTPNEMEWSWQVQTSRFIAEGYPRLAYFENVPNPLRVKLKDSENTPMVLGVSTSFNRKGDNWFEILPTTTDENGDMSNHEIPLQGNVAQLDFWVWGGNYLYYLEVLVRDADGRVHVLKAGDLAFSGWKNVVINVPTYIRQRSKLRTGARTLTFVGFRVRTDPNEYVDDFKVYFDQIRYTANLLDEIYDGYDLNDADFTAATANSGEAGQ